MGKKEVAMCRPQLSEGLVDIQTKVTNAVLCEHSTRGHQAGLN